MEREISEQNCPKYLFVSLTFKSELHETKCKMNALNVNQFSVYKVLQAFWKPLTVIIMQISQWKFYHASNHHGVTNGVRMR